MIVTNLIKRAIDNKDNYGEVVLNELALAY